MTGLTPEQKTTRLQGISSSEVSWIVGLSSWGSPSLLYKVKCEGHEIPDNPYMERGREKEQVLLDSYAARWGVELAFPGTLKHPTRPLLIATPDAVAMSPGCANGVLVEAKVVNTDNSAKKWGRPGTDEIPPAYLCQVQYAMGVVGLREAHLPVLMPDDSQALYKVPFDALLFEYLAAAAEDFWRRYIETKIPPPGYRKSKPKQQEEKHAHE